MVSFEYKNAHSLLTSYGLPYFMCLIALTLHQQEPLLPSSPHLAPTLILRIETLTMTSKPVAIVVGASRGIGRQIAIDLAKDGYAGETP